MNELHTTSEQLPLRSQPLVVERIIEKPVKPSLVSRVGVSMLGNTLIGLVSGTLWGWVPFVLAAVLGIIGWKVTPPKAIADKAHSLEQRLEDAADKVTGRVEGTARKAAPALILAGMPQGKTPEQVLALDRAKADALGIDWGEDWPHEKFAVEIPRTEKARADAEQQARDDKRRAALIERATRVNLGVNPDLELSEMEKQVKEAEAYVKADADYQLAHRLWEEAIDAYRSRIAAGPNANCPACHLAMRLRTTNADYKAICPRCRYITTRRLMLAEHRYPPPPAEPQPPKLHPSLWERFIR